MGGRRRRSIAAPPRAPDALGPPCARHRRARSDEPGDDLCTACRQLRRPQAFTPDSRFPVEFAGVPSTAPLDAVQPLARRRYIAPPPRCSTGLQSRLRDRFCQDFDSRPEGSRSPVPDHVSAATDDDLSRTWHGVRRELRAEVPDLTFHIWIDPLELAGAARDPPLRPRARPHPHLGRGALPAAPSRGRVEGPGRLRAARHRRRQVDARGGRRPARARITAAGRPAWRRLAASTRSTPSSSSSSATATGWPTARPSPSPSSPGRPTTRSSSRDRPDSARPTFSTPSATTSARTAAG